MMCLDLKGDNWNVLGFFPPFLKVLSIIIIIC